MSIKMWHFPLTFNHSGRVALYFCVQQLLHASNHTTFRLNSPHDVNYLGDDAAGCKWQLICRLSWFVFDISVCF